MIDVLAVGTRVTRRAKGYLIDPALPDRHGAIIQVYNSSAKMGAYVEGWVRYAVLWDDTNQIEKDYIREGLGIEAKA